MADDPPIVKKKTLTRDSERYVQSTHNVLNYQELALSQNKKPSFDGTGNFQDAFNLVDHSAYDLSQQPPEENRMNYMDHNQLPPTEYDLPPDSVYHHEEDNALRQISNVFSVAESEHIPELLIQQKIEQLLDLSKTIQVFKSDGKPADPQFTNSLRIRRIKQLGSGTQGEVFLSEISANNKKFTCVIKLRKILNNDRLCESIFLNMFREFEIGRQLSHPNIIKNLYYVRKKNDSDEQENAILLELMEGGNAQEYLDLLPEKKITNLDTLRSFTRQICEAVFYLH